jgi:hypothetical protein
MRANGALNEGLTAVPTVGARGVEQRQRFPLDVRGVLPNSQGQRADVVVVERVS